jgi:hypothetical protein
MTVLPAGHPDAMVALCLPACVGLATRLPTFPPGDLRPVLTLGDLRIYD